MCPLRRVTDTEAGPDAVGLLLPPGRLTWMIVRPRSLACDLLLVQSAADSAFRPLSRDEATIVAQKVYRALERWINQGDGEAAAIETSGGTTFWLRVRMGSFFFLACPRQPGQPYQPQAYADRDAAQAASRELARALCPSADVEREIYFNIRHFTP